MKFGPEDIETLAKHVTQFSLAALKELRRTNDRKQLTPLP